MMRIVLKQKTRKLENTVTLINIVFLMLIFFLVAGTLAPAPDREVDLVALAASDPAAPPDMLFIRADGSLTWRGEAMPLADHVARWQSLQLEQGNTPKPMRIAADRTLAAIKLLDQFEALRRAGIQNIVLLAERQNQ